MAPNANHDGEDPPSPDTKDYIDNYTPSKERQEEQDFFGRRHLRIINGQDPEKNPEKFTPLEDQRMKWPTNDEAYAWAKNAKDMSRKRAIFDNAERKIRKLLCTPVVCAAAAGDGMLETNENVPAVAAPVAGPPMPFQLEANDAE